MNRAAGYEQDGSYSHAKMLADTFARGLPVGAYSVENACTFVGHANAYGQSTPASYKVVSARLTMTIPELKSKIAQLDEQARDVAERRAAEVEADNAETASRKAELVAVLEAARAAASNIRGLHAAFDEAFAEAFATVEAERDACKLQPASDSKARAPKPGELRTLLAEECDRLEAEQNADDARILAVLARKGISV
ncbi:MAG: hypothetical protein JWN04_1708 [Myxococcaceae bacterium]|nr:hypothetical protein [Myxococcaceae bacterium]